MQALTADGLRAWLADASREPPLLLDVREPWEFERCSIQGSLLIPMRDIPARCAELEATRETVVICQHGIRSRQVALFLERYGFSQLHNLEGGIEAWRR